MGTTVVTPQPTTQTPSKAATITDAVLHDVLLLGALAASIFVKNPAHQQTAGLLINAVNNVLQTIDKQLGIQSGQ